MHFSRLYSLSVLAALALALPLSGCATLQRDDATNVHHLVLVWLKTPGDEPAKALLTQTSRRFAEIPGVVSVKVGEAIASDRPIVDSTYDLAILIVLEDREALAEYLAHPQHKAAQAEVLRPLVEQVRIFDYQVVR